MSLYSVNRTGTYLLKYRHAKYGCQCLVPLCHFSWPIYRLPPLRSAVQMTAITAHDTASFQADISSSLAGAVREPADGSCSHGHQSHCRLRLKQTDESTVLINLK